MNPADDDDGLAAWDIDIECLQGLDKLIRDDVQDANRFRWRYGRHRWTVAATGNGYPRGSSMTWAS